MADGFQSDAFQFAGFQMNVRAITMAMVGGSYAITGTSATLNKLNKRMALDSGSYTVTGSAAVLMRFVLAAGSGSYTISGSDVTLRRPLSIGYVWVWDGIDWVEKPLKVWNGTSWEVKPVKYYDSGDGWTLA